MSNQPIDPEDEARVAAWYAFWAMVHRKALARLAIREDPAYNPPERTFA